MQLALAGADLGCVAVPFLIDPLGSEVPFDQIRGTPATRSGPGGRPASPAAPRRQACSRISAATVFSLTLTPASHRSAVILGAP